MGIVVPETCWASNKICNKIHLLHLVGILFPHNVQYCLHVGWTSRSEGVGSASVVKLNWVNGNHRTKELQVCVVWFNGFTLRDQQSRMMKERGGRQMEAEPRCRSHRIVQPNWNALRSIVKEKFSRKERSILISRKYCLINHFYCQTNALNYTKLRG